MFVVRQNGLRVRSAFAALVMVGLAGAAPAVAAEREVGVAVVSTSGLDLRSPGGVALLHRRLEAAAREACGWEPTDVVADRDFQACRKDALAGAQPSVTAMVAAAQQQHGSAIVASNGPN